MKHSKQKYKNLSELAQAMRISVSQVYRVKEGKRNINQKFIIARRSKNRVNYVVIF